MKGGNATRGTLSRNPGRQPVSKEPGSRQPEGGHRAKVTGRRPLALAR